MSEEVLEDIQLLSLVFYILFSVLDVVSLRRKNITGHRVFKPFLMPTLAAFYLSSSEIFGYTGWYGILVLTALGLHWLGDVLLLFANGRTNFAFYAGATCFGLGHVAYFFWIVFFVKFISVRIIAVALAVVVPLYILLAVKANNTIGRGRLFKGLLIYAAIMALIAIAAASTIGQGPLYGSLLVLFGYIIFIFSDSIIASGKLGSPIAGQPAVMTTYCMAQLMIIIGILVLQG